VYVFDLSQQEQKKRRASDRNTRQGLTPDLKLATWPSERGVSVADSAALAAQLLGCDDAVLLKVLLQVSSRVEFSMKNIEGMGVNFHTTVLRCRGRSRLWGNPRSWRFSTLSSRCGFVLLIVPG
jgi:hypothetical protein